MLTEELPPIIDGDKDSARRVLRMLQGSPLPKPKEPPAQITRNGIIVTQ